MGRATSDSPKTLNLRHVDGVTTTTAATRAPQAWRGPPQQQGALGDDGEWQQRDESDGARVEGHLGMIESRFMRDQHVITM